MIAGDFTVVVPPAEELISIDEAKTHVRFTSSAEDTAIEIQLAAAREHCELVARRAFVAQTIELRLHCWPAAGMLQLPRPPLQEVLAVEYTASNGELHTLPSTNYVVYHQTEPGQLVLKPSANWPREELMPGPSICVRYVAGYGAPEAVPVRYKQAVLLLFGTWFANREHLTVGTIAHEMPDALQALLLTDRGYV